MKTTHTIIAIVLTLALGRVTHAQYVSGQIYEVDRSEPVVEEPDVSNELRNASRALSEANQVLQLKNMEYRRKVQQTIQTRGSLTHNGRMLVIPTTPMNTNQREEIAEDMQIMGRIFAMKSPLLVPKKHSCGSMLLSNQISILDINHPSIEIEGIYLQDFGFLFFMNATIPLLPPDQPQETVTTEKKDTLWEKARHELSTPPDDTWKLFSISRTKKKKQKLIPYNAESVEKLENGLIESLKYAANIRHLQPNGRIILHVTGNTGQQGQQGHLTIRAKWSDINAYHKEKINTDAFKKKVVKIMLITKDSSPHPGSTSRYLFITPTLPTSRDKTDAPR